MKANMFQGNIKDNIATAQTLLKLIIENKHNDMSWLHSSVLPFNFKELLASVSLYCKYLSREKEGVRDCVGWGRTFP